MENSSAQFQQFVKHILSFEGGLSKDPRDTAVRYAPFPGAYHTNKGVTYAAFTALGPKIVVVKKGNQGAELFCPMGQLHMEVHPVDKVVDPTGAGDSFAAGFLGYLAQSGAPLTDFPALKTALMYANAMASFTVEKFGPESLETLTHDQLLSRVKFYQT